MDERRLRVIRGKPKPRTPKSFWLTSLALLVLYVAIRAYVGAPTPTLQQGSATPREAVTVTRLNTAQEEPNQDLGVTETAAPQGWPQDVLRALPGSVWLRDRLRTTTFRLQPVPPAKPTAP